MNKKGFTVIELVLVVSIISILLLMARPSIQVPLERSILETEAQKIAGDIRLTQQLAYTQGRDFHFEIDITERYYKIRPSNPFESSIKRETLDRRIKRITCNFAGIPGGSHSSLKRLTYTPTGIPSQTGTIELIMGSGIKKSIRVAVATGRVVIR
ncbi:MAG TPA: type II secretion system protein [Clostridiales bacterium]|nr:type II secretion system protein [Clostridiales bacterium]